ncbi:MAG: hypothetical protein Q9157_005773 [Trypethelium eluteriae]
MQPHIEGGYFVETDRDSHRVPNPFLLQEAIAQPAHIASQTAQGKHLTRAASTTIFYLITPKSPLGAFHRNRGRTVHTLHRGRGRYVIVHANEVMRSYDENDAAAGGKEGRKARVETFVVGKDLEKGERLQWIVDGGKYKASFLLPDEEGREGSEGLLISEVCWLDVQLLFNANCGFDQTVVPGFEYEDHDFMRQARLERLVTAEQAKELQWLMRKDA